MKRIAALRVGIVLALTLGASGVSAREDAASSEDGVQSARESGVEEIVITARRRKELVQDAPISISAVGGERLEVERLNRVSEYAAKLPSFQAIQSNPRASALTVRGLGGNAGSDGSESGVGLIVDDVFFTHAGFAFLDFVDLDHIEVARGPQGTLLGKNTTIGALIVTTRPPSFEPEGRFSATIGNQGRYQLRTNLSGPLIGESLAGRITFYGDTTDGAYENKEDGVRFQNTNRYGVRGQLLYNGSDGFTNRTILERYQTREYNNFSPPVADQGTFANGTPRANSYARRLQERFGFTPNFDAPDNANVDTQEAPRSNVWGVSNRADWEVGDHTLTSVTAWRQFYFRPRNDSDASPFAILRNGIAVDVAQYSQELRLASPAGRTFDYQLGVFALREDVRSELRTFFFGDASTFYVGSGADPAILDGVEVDQLGRTRVSSYAGFAQTTWNVTDRFTLTTGIRYTQETRTASNEGDLRGGTPLSAADDARRASVTRGFGSVFKVSDRDDNGSFAWLFNPSYRFSDSVLGYLTISQGEKSGAGNLSATPGRPVIIEPEKSTAYEIGLKTTWLDGRATLNGNLYLNDVEDYQANEINPNRTVGGTVLGNVGKVRLRGLEVEGSLQVTPNLNVNLSGALNDAEYVSYDNAPPPPEFQFPGGPAAIDLSGERLQGSSRWSGQVSVSYDHPLNDRFELFLYANERVRSAADLANPVSDYAHQSGYGVANGGIGIRRSDGKYSVQLWVKNAFDEEYALTIGSGSGTTPITQFRGEQRTFGLTVTMNTF
jgi:iron complex outermembrane recepter protein